MSQNNRCAWCIGKPLYEQYHDTEWGVPIHDDATLFEFLVLESAQAGLSWWTILQRREHYRKAFLQFDYKKIAKFDETNINRLMQNPGIIRNRAKIVSVINNAKKFIKVQKEFGSFNNYLWGFVGGKPRDNKRKALSEVPATTAISDTLTKDLKKRGFTFFGSTTVYAYMQAVGMVNDHATNCFQYQQVKKLVKNGKK
jgi:DNA-3-methyladenine glycosylase I